MIFVKNNVFHLNTAQSSYIFRVTEQGDLEHLYYGRKIKFQENYKAFFKKIRFCLSARCILKRMLLTELIKCVPTDIKKFVPF